MPTFIRAHDIREQVRQYIVQNFIFDENGKIAENQSLIRSGVLDSTGVLELIVFLEQCYNLHFDDSELTEENFDTLDALSAFIERKIHPKDLV
jgi:acyl carrier protein